MRLAGNGGATPGRPASLLTPDDLEHGTERLARLALNAQALADRKRAAAVPDALTPAARESVRRLEAGVALARTALQSTLGQALGRAGRPQSLRLVGQPHAEV